MNSTNKKAPGARGIPQPFSRHLGHAPQHKPVVAQLKNGVSTQRDKQPVAPPVYRPQPVPRVLQTKSVTGQHPRAAQPPRQPVAPPVYRPEAKKIVQPKTNSQLRQSATAPPVYRPEQKRVAQPKMALAAKAHTPPKAPPVYRPQSKLASVQAKIAGTSQLNNRPVAPPVYRPQPVPRVLQTKKAVTQLTTARIPVHTPGPKPAMRPTHSNPAGTIQRVVNPQNSDITSSGKYLVEHGNPSVLYSTLDAAPPLPYGLYARGADFIAGKTVNIPLNSWTPNVRFIDKKEVLAEPVLEKPGTFTYKKPNAWSSTTYSIGELQNEVRNPRPGLDGPPTVGALGKNDCNIWATTLQNMIADERGACYLHGDTKRTVRIQSLATTPEDLNVKVGDLMKHIYEGAGACNYHAATIVAKDGDSLVTLEGHVSKDLSRPQFHVRGGLTGFAAEGIEHDKGDKVEVIPGTSLTYEDVQSDKETRENRFRGFSDINPVFWKDYEGEMYSYRGRLAGDIGITPTVEKRRRDELARQLKLQFEEIYQRDRQRHLEGKPPVYTSFPRID